MNNIITFDISSPRDIALQIAARVKARRLELDLTQEGLAARAGVKFATYRRFEQTGEISLRGLLQVGFALNALSDFDVLFAQKQYQSLDDVLNEQSVIRKRGKKMNSIKQIEVIYDNRLVGRLALTKESLCAFEYSAEWLNSGFLYLRLSYRCAVGYL